MIAIVNVSPEDAPLTGTNQYEVRINQKVITRFEHERGHDGLAQCLRDAADAVDSMGPAVVTTREQLFDKINQAIIIRSDHVTRL